MNLVIHFFVELAMLIAYFPFVDVRSERLVERATVVRTVAGLRVLGENPHPVGTAASTDLEAAVTVEAELLGF